MRGSKAKNLSSLFRQAVKKATTNSSSKSTNSNLKVLEKTPSPNSSKNLTSTLPYSKEPSKVSSKGRSKKLPATQLEALNFLSRETLSCNSEESDNELLKSISSILGGSTSLILDSQKLPDLEAVEDDVPAEKILDIPWLSSTTQAHVSQRRKEISRERKQKWVFKDTQGRRFERLIKMCGQKLGAKTTVEVFGKLGRETGLKEYSALVGLCVEKARASEDEDACLDHIHRAYQLLTAMKEHGFQLQEKTYGPLLMYLIDMRMVEEFYFFCVVIRDEKYGKFSRLGYYEMMLWIRAGNDDKVQELCNRIVADNGNDEDTSHLADNYLIALCENDREKEILQLLEVVDIPKVLSLQCVSYIFKFFGRLLLESSAEKFILALKTSEVEAEKFSYFICNYATSMPNLGVEDVISNFNNLHERLDVMPSSTSFEELIRYCCDSLEVHTALGLADKMCQLGLTISKEIFNPLLRAVEESCELDLVHPIYSLICRHKSKANGDNTYGEIFRSLINFCVKIKDFAGAYNILTDLKKTDIKPTASMYNAILAGYFRDKNFCGALSVIYQMKRADVKPDSHTFSYLIGNAKSEDDIIKYLEELQSAGVQPTKHVYMSLVNAYVNCGLIEKAKQVALDEEIPSKSINEIKSVLVSALASHGQMSDALKIYEEIKQAGCIMEPKATISLIEYLQSEGELNRLLMLLGELNDSDLWFDGCERIILYCIRHKHLSSAVDLLKLLQDTDAVLDQAFCQISETQPTALDIGMDLLKAIKEELKISPSRTSLDFLLSACVSAKDTLRAQFIWEEYQKAGLPVNVLTNIRMYQVLLACGEHSAAKRMLKEVQKDDPHVRHIITACQETFSRPNSVKNTKKKKKKKNT